MRSWKLVSLIALPLLVAVTLVAPPATTSAATPIKADVSVQAVPAPVTPTTPAVDVTAEAVHAYLAHLHDEVMAFLHWLSSQPVVPTSAFEACVIGRESGGKPEVMNGSGHWGLYQASEQLWVAYGEPASTWGNGSGIEQQAWFHRVIAAGGASNWRPYDHC